ncbi:hypothetical protein GQ55_4G005300 [Panicum hallii var. hallii]|uniref:Uncharacterized protein n=1 Tax=Panicum hallii var. hallii TaxID=1504633 RepID=A0A2T7DTT3_9POAL|nr:hypothetical protein GQ55_4G005300 [Panicum hallii var. hallii]PUZ58984.1 hypothetical protein GQ55_4G005300 [Panicum hallii var. hallii]PUZ58985.1 hypothetical protein GQ55_4G005300 [Panicum hallii var. hallii]
MRRDLCFIEKECLILGSVPLLSICTSLYAFSSFFPMPSVLALMNQIPRFNVFSYSLVRRSVSCMRSITTFVAITLSVLCFVLSFKVVGRVRCAALKNLLIFAALC